MDSSGQAYFDLADHIPEADRKRLLDADATYDEREAIEAAHRQASEKAIQAELATFKDAIADA